MADALVFHRLQFAFTIIYHYLFPQLTMGLALLIVFMKALGLRQGGERWNDAARFWIRIFGINFAVGVVTGIPMEFQFGTNWAKFSRYAGSVIGQTLAMEGFFAFFLESSFLSVLVWGERRLSKTGHFFAAAALFFGSCLEALTAFLQKIGLASSEIEIARRVLSEQSHHELPDLKGVPDDPSATRGARHASIGAGAKSPMSDTSDDSIRREVSKLRRVDYRGKVVLFVVSSQS